MAGMPQSGEPTDSPWEVGNYQLIGIIYKQFVTCSNGSANRRKEVIEMKSSSASSFQLQRGEAEGDAPFPAVLTSGQTLTGLKGGMQGW